MDECLSGFQPRYVDGNWSGFQLRSNPTITLGHGTDNDEFDQKPTLPGKTLVHASERTLWNKCSLPHQPAWHARNIIVLVEVSIDGIV